MPDLNKKEKNLTSNFNTTVFGKIRRLSKNEVFFSKVKRRIFSHVKLIRYLIGISLVVFVSLFFLIVIKTFERSSAVTYLSYIYNFVFTPEGGLKKLDERTNIIILGKGGGVHEAPDLTDSIILTSISHKKNEITNISLPRDIWIPDLRAKLNSAYYWGNKKVEGGGIILAKSETEKITGLSIQYAVVIDFDGFIKVIDILDGIEVDVERNFIDEKYPIEGRENYDCDNDPEYKCRYETVKFEKGLQEMDSETALKYSRSRNAEGDEGTDFARAARQEKLMVAIKNKILSRSVLFSPKKLIELKNALSEFVETDINAKEGAIIARRIFSSRKNIHSYVFPEELLINPPKSPEYDNLYVFMPKDGLWDDVHKWFEKILAE